MSLAIDDLLAHGTPDDAAVAAFVEGREFPIVEGDRVTFLFRGQADEVNLRHWIYGLTSANPFRRIPDSDLWVLVFTLPPCSRVDVPSTW